MVHIMAILLLCIRGFLKHVYRKVNNRGSIIYFILTFLLILIIEVVIYNWMVLFWHQLKCYDKKECTKLLLVADPQLIGLHNEYIPTLTSIAIWDSDRYLSNTYSHAFRFVDPDVVIFLGDLLDEGSSGNDKEFNLYVNRFYNIFKKQENTLHIWIAGDNDIGGEYPDYVTQHKVERFNKAFSQPDVVTYNNLRFFKANMFQYKVPGAQQSENNTNLNIVLSHVPLLSSFSSFLDKVLDTVNPKLLFTAHTHASAIRMSPRKSRHSRITSSALSNNEVRTYNLDSDNLVEITVPTCSYRMGTKSVGYGFAILEKSEVKYTVLWTPSRLYQLIIYGFFCIFLILSSLYKCTKKTAKYVMIQTAV